MIFGITCSQFACRITPIMPACLVDGSRKVTFHKDDAGPVAPRTAQISLGIGLGCDLAMLEDVAIRILGWSGSSGQIAIADGTNLAILKPRSGRTKNEIDRTIDIATIEYLTRTRIAGEYRVLEAMDVTVAEHRTIGLAMHGDSLSDTCSIRTCLPPIGVVMRHGIVDDGHILTLESFTQHEQCITFEGTRTMSPVAAIDELIIVSHGIGHRTEHHTLEAARVLQVGMVVPDEDTRVAVFADDRDVGLVGGHDDLLFVGSFPDEDALTPLGFVIADGENGILDGKIISRTILRNYHIVQLCSHIICKSEQKEHGYKPGYSFHYREKGLIN